MSKARLHIPEPYPHAPQAPWFTALPETPYTEHWPENFFTAVQRVSLVEAQAIVLPNNFRVLDDAARAYLSRWSALGERDGIPVFAFSLGDFTDHLHFDPRVCVFCLSLYRSSMQPNDIVMPTLAADLGAGGIAVRDKRPTPVVSFCGQAGYRTLRQWGAYAAKNLFYELCAVAQPSIRARKLGVYWRRAALRACRRSTLVKSSFITRRSFSGAYRTIELPPQEARQEFIANIHESDFVLAPKGDGNYSNRFLEALSMGRIPVLIDTDSVLPLEDTIDYSKIIVRVPMEQVAETPRYIRAFYDSLSQEEWHARQKLARETFEKYLRQDSFFRFFFERLVLQ